jgi:hypothetical protein
MKGRSMNKSEMIRTASSHLDVKATNKQVTEYCEREFGYKPSPQHILAAVGSEKDRLAQCFTGRELRDVKRFTKNKFDGDFKRLENAIRVVVANGRMV